MDVVFANAVTRMILTLTHFFTYMILAFDAPPLLNLKMLKKRATLYCTN